MVLLFIGCIDRSFMILLYKIKKDGIEKIAAVSLQFFYAVRKK